MTRSDRRLKRALKDTRQALLILEQLEYLNASQPLTFGDETEGEIMRIQAHALLRIASLRTS